MRPPTWNPPIDMSPTEQIVAKRIKKAKLFLFLRQIRHLLFEQQVQKEKLFASPNRNVRLVFSILNVQLALKVGLFLFILMNLYGRNYVNAKPLLLVVRN